jgi:hypothetical protein
MGRTDNQRVLAVAPVSPSMAQPEIRKLEEARADRAQHTSRFAPSGAGRGNRTPTGLLAPADFKSAASANFAIPAIMKVLNFTARFALYVLLHQDSQCETV